jgi:malonyl CoA-acyl carrier protein transacylase
MPQTSRQQIPIAVVGVSALFPGSTDARGFWNDILAGKDLITDVPSSHWLIEDYYDPDPRALDKTYSKRGGFLPTVDFDPLEFGVPPSIVPATDSAQILALIVAQKVLEDASQGQFATMDRERISVLLGVTSAQELLGSMTSRLQKPVWLKALRESGIPETEAQEICGRIAKNYTPWQESTFPGLLGNVVAGRIANRFDLRGTNAVTDAACASSLAAVSMGINELQIGQSDLVITGGVDAMNDIFMYMCFSKTPALSPSGDCRPFSDNADGTLLGEGIAMLALKRLEDAERDGDRVYAVIRGVGSASDGRANSVYAPLPEGQARSLRRAYQVAGFGPETVELVEAHGTGTKAGDAAEFAGLKLAFGGVREDNQWCALGSVKSQIGHTKAAAGAAGLFKAVMALHHKVLPPTIKVDRPNPKLEIEKSPFYLNTQRRPWIRNSAHPRRASVSSFGFGGSNFHIALEEYVPSVPTGKRAWSLRTMPTELLLLSAANPAELVTKCRAIASSNKDLSHLARETQLSFSTKDNARLAVIAANFAELTEKLKQAAATIEKAPGIAYSSPIGMHYSAGAADAGQVAFLFPGQGSQYVGMGAETAMAFDLARKAWDDAANLPFGGECLQDVVFPRPVFTDADRDAQQKRLTATEWAQPALGVHSQALSNVLKAIGVRPACVAGHSFGEVSALHEAGVIDAETLVKVARRRGELMRDASAVPGAMTAVAKPIDEVRAAVTASGANVVIANHNSPTQVVLSGSVDEITKVEAALSSQGMTAKRLPVATAFHSPLVAGSSAPFRTFLDGETVTAPQFDVYSNATAAPYTKKAVAIREQLAGQLAQPVRFVEMIEAMYARGVRTFVEVGAGSVLTDLVGRILSERQHCAICLDRKGKHGVTTLQEGLGRLALAGVAMDLAALWAPFAPPSDKPLKKPAMTMPISGSNYGHPYPPVGGAKELPPPNPARAMPAMPAMTLAPAQAVAASNAPEANLAWVQAFQETQRQTAEVHAAYQRAMADSHMAFLKTAELSFASLGAMLGNDSNISPAQTAFSPMPKAALVASSLPVPVAAPIVTLIAPPIAPTPSPTPSVDLEALMMTIVAEKTGYPKEMLGTHMELEADLGIDSIKRVEILSALRERAPHLPEVKATELALLRTLGQIVEHMHAAGGAVFSESLAAPESPSPLLNLEALMMTIVAEKTGYPKEMLGAHMELEADLGIDSIKRVEILSALRERAPHLPEVKATELALLRTLGQIVEHMRAAGGTACSEPLATPAAPSPSLDLEALMMTIVAEKTGYPKEMLSAHMELEADLGIDSIKRVEILSALRERALHLPEVKATELALLRTLGQIVEHMRNANGTMTLKTPTVLMEASAVSTQLTNVQRFAVREVLANPVGMAMPGVLGAQHLVVTDDGTGVASALVASLSKHGVKAAMVSTVPADADAVIFLGGLRAVKTVDDSVAVNREAFHASRAIAVRFEKDGGTFITVQDTGGDFGLSGRDGTRAFLGGVSALARTAALEWPKAAVKAIDLERGPRDASTMAEAIITELLTGGSTLEVGLHADGRRTTLASVRTSSPAPTGVKLDSTSIVVASGGGRGVTAASLVALAKISRPRIVLLGRTPLNDEPLELSDISDISDEAGLKRALLLRAQAEGLTPTPAELNIQLSALQALREIRATLAMLKAAGSESRYISVDVADAVALSTALDTVRQEWGPITALVHGAGVLADKRIEEKTDEQFDRVFDTKVSGLRALLAATANDPLTALCLFSSVAARTGNPGQCDYAMANEVLNLVACAERARRGPSCVVRAIGWGPWEGGMVTPSLKHHFQQMGVPLIPLAVGTQRFVEELVGGGDDITVIIGGSQGDSAIGALGAKATPQGTVEVNVHERSHSYLADHCIAGIPVVPMVLAVEWFLRAARACRPDLVLASVKQVKVLRGIKLKGFTGAGDRFVITARQISNGSDAEVGVELRGVGDVLHYSATVHMTEYAVAQPTIEAPPELEKWTQDTVYDGHVLFHGPSFQVIDSVKGISREGIVGTLSGTQKSEWPVESWRSDAAAMDGGLQLALLWSQHVLGGAVLPMAMSEYRSYRDGLTQGPMKGVVFGRKIHDARTVCDITFSDSTDQVVAEFIGVETVLRPVEITLPPGQELIPVALA